MQLGLALSGGGFRATLFHLGVVRALLDRGLLRHVRHITSVSGGSILAAHLVKNWCDYSRPETFAIPAAKIIEFARSDVRGRVFRRLALPHSLFLPYLEHLRHWPPRLRRDGTVRNHLFERYLRELYGDVLLSDLAGDQADAPTLDILTTNLTHGSLAYFSNGILVANDDYPEEEVETPITAARAVMASALFPAVFPTVEFNADALRVDQAKFPTSQYFTDGGVYDNLGIRRFRTLLAKKGCPIEKVLVSDASGAFDWLIGSETLGQWKTALRSSEVFMKRLADLECEIAGGRKSQQYTFLRISDVIDDGTLPETVQQQIKHIRTDLDRFSIPEVRALVIHGYEVAADATKDASAEKCQAWDPFSSAKNETEARLVDRLRRSRFHPWGLFNRRDWTSYVYPALLVVALLFAVDWYRGESLHRYYQKEFMMDGDVPSIANVQRATSLVERAVRRPHRDQTHRLEAALLAYALDRQLNDQLSKELFESARANLDAPHLTDFHRAKWRHYYANLPSTTFGFPAYGDASAALAFVEDATNNLASHPSIQFEAALLSYGVYATERGAEVKQRAFDLGQRALTRVNPADQKLSDVYRFRATLLKGHYFLARGEKAHTAADNFLSDQLNVEASTKYKEAEISFQEAATTYKAARDLHFTELWKVHQNVCNATLNSAAAAIGYIKSKEPMPDADKQQLQEVIDQNLRAAEASCTEAKDALPPMANKWQPSFALASVALKQGRRETAAERFVEGSEIARRANELPVYNTWLKAETDVTSLCRFTSFSRALPDACR